jgi:hypothetical protein
MTGAILAFTSPNLFEAELVLSALRESGVRATLRAPTLALPEVWVDAAHRARAAEVLARLEPTAAGARALDPCARCGEASPPGFEVCWSCETALPGR